MKALGSIPPVLFGIVVLALILWAFLILGALSAYKVGFLHAGRWQHYSSGGSFIGCKPSMSPDGSTVVYSSPRSGRGDIYRVGRDGLKTVRLTDDPNYEGHPEYSPNGSTIVFIREEDNVGHVWVMDADGSRQRQLTAGPADDSNPQFSPDGSRIVFMRYVRDWKFTPSSIASTEVFVMNADGSGQMRLTNNNYPDGAPSFSPDGKQLVFGTTPKYQFEIWRMDQDGSNRQRLGRGSSPSFSPNGKQILFIDDRTQEFEYDLYIMDEPSKQVKLITTSGGYKSSPSFCLGGTHILFLDEPTKRGVGKVTIIDLADLTTEVITTTE